MKRRSFLVLLASAVALPAQQVPRKKWYITGGNREDPTQGDCGISPIVTYGSDMLEALANSGMTVWPEEDYLRMRKEVGKQFDDACKFAKREEGKTNE